VGDLVYCFGFCIYKSYEKGRVRKNTSHPLCAKTAKEIDKDGKNTQNEEEPKKTSAL
jgi:hypothetical protein